MQQLGAGVTLTWGVHSTARTDKHTALQKRPGRCQGDIAEILLVMCWLCKHPESTEPSADFPMGNVQMKRAILVFCPAHFVLSVLFLGNSDHNRLVICPMLITNIRHLQATVISLRNPKRLNKLLCMYWPHIFRQLLIGSVVSNLFVVFIYSFIVFKNSSILKPQI